MARVTARGRAVQLLLLLVSCCCVVAAASAVQAPSNATAATEAAGGGDVKHEPKMPEEETQPPRGGNETRSTGVKMGEPLKLNPGAVLRAFYVFVGLSAIVVLYIIVRTVRLRRRKLTVRKYGILASRDDVEMAPLDREDDDEDTTLFDLTSSQGGGGR